MVNLSFVFCVLVRKLKYILVGIVIFENDVLCVRYFFVVMIDIVLIGIIMFCFLRLFKDKFWYNSVDDCLVLNCVILSGNEFWFLMEKKNVCDVIFFDDRIFNCILNILFV